MTDRPVSHIRGRRQAPALRAVTLVAWMLAGLGSLEGASWSHLSAAVAVGLVVATPLLRVGWLTYRWGQERDWPFVVLAALLIAMIATGGLLTLIGSSS